MKKNKPRIYAFFTYWKELIDPIPVPIIDYGEEIASYNLDIYLIKKYPSSYIGVGPIYYEEGL